MVETRKNVDTTLPATVGANNTYVDPNAKKVVRETSSGNVIGVGADPHRTGVLPSVTKGQVPSNQQIDVALNNAKQSLENVQPQLSSQGRRIAQDTEVVIESAQRMLHNKNQDEKLQRLVREATLSGRQGNLAAQQIRADPHDTSALTRETFENAKDLTLYLIRHPEFRTYLSEVFQFFRSVIQDIQMKHGGSLKQAVSQDSSMLRNNMQQGETIQQTEFIQQGGYVNTTTSTMTTNQQLPLKQGIQQSSTANVLSNVAQDMRHGNLGDERMKWTLEQRWENLLFTLSQNPQYNKIISNLYTIFDTFRERKERLSADPNYVGQSTHYHTMMTDSWNLLAEFVGQRPLQEFETIMWQIYTDLKGEPMARDFFTSFREYLRVSVESPETLTDDYRREHGRLLFNQANTLFRLEQNKHSHNFNRMFELLSEMMHSIRYDSDTLALSESVGRLAKDIVFDDQGRPDIFVAQESLDQLKRMIIPMVQRQLETIPLPMIEGSNEKYDFRVENLIMNGRDILPDYFDLKMVNNLGLGTKQGGNRVHAKLKLRASNMRVAFPNMHYFYRRKKMPKLEDNGIADVAILGSGLNMKITWHLFVRDDKPLTFELARVKVFIDKMDINVKQSRHKLINKIALKIFGGAIKRRVSQAIVEKVRDTLTPFNNQLNDFFRRERESHRFRERANVRLQSAYETRKDGPSLTEKAKNAVHNVAQPLMNKTQQHQERTVLVEQQQQPILTEKLATATSTSGSYVNVDSTQYGTVLAEHEHHEKKTIQPSTFDMNPLQQSLPSNSKVDHSHISFEKNKEKLEQKLPGTMKEDSGRWSSSWYYEPNWSDNQSQSPATRDIL